MCREAKLGKNGQWCACMQSNGDAGPVPDGTAGEADHTREHAQAGHACAHASVQRAISLLQHRQHRSLVNVSDRLLLRTAVLQWPAP